MASRENKNKVVDLTNYIKSGKEIKIDKYYFYSLKLINYLTSEKEDKEKIFEIFGIFLSKFLDSISFEYTNLNKKEEVIFELISTFNYFCISKYNDISILLKCITLYFSY